VALLLVSREGRLAEAGSPSRLYVALGQQLLGLVYAAVFTFCGFFLGAVCPGFLRKFNDFRSEWEWLGQASRGPSRRRWKRQMAEAHGPNFARRILDHLVCSP
jgi:hypothetical protein